jgi:hypothetical protein
MEAWQVLRTTSKYRLPAWIFIGFVGRHVVSACQASISVEGTTLLTRGGLDVFMGLSSKEDLPSSRRLVEPAINDGLYEDAYYVFPQKTRGCHHRRALCKLFTVRQQVE